jgi:hypothetical protein
VCEWGTHEKVRVKIQADLSCTGKEHWKYMKIDACISLIVRALQRGGIDMRGSCCGHGKGHGLGRIDLQDGRTLFIEYPKEDANHMRYEKRRREAR